MSLKNLKVKKVESTLLKETGNYLMNVTRFEFEMDSFQKNFDHEVKENIKELQEKGELWIDPTPQLAITFGSTEGKGVITNRFHAKGYVSKDDPEVTEDMLNKDGIMTIGKYVCKETKKGWERIEAPAKTEQALNILFGFLNKLGLTNEEEDIETALTRACEDKYSIVITVSENEYDGKTHLYCEKFSKATLSDVENVEEEVTASDFEKE